MTGDINSWAGSGSGSGFSPSSGGTRI